VNPAQDVDLTEKAILECQKHNNYQESIRWLLGIFEEYGKHGRHIASVVKDAGSQVASVRYL
jgi:hypothetical protein